MSLWTPDGEHPVGAETGAAPQPDAAPEPGAAAEPGAIPGLEDLTDEERAQAEQIAAELAEARQRLAEVDAATVVANHAMGLYELAAIHLGQQPPALTEASVAIDAMAGVVDALPGRLGENEPVLREALHQLRLAYVQLQGEADGPTEAAGDS